MIIGLYLDEICKGAIALVAITRPLCSGSLDAARPPRSDAVPGSGLVLTTLLWLNGLVQEQSTSSERLNGAMVNSTALAEILGEDWRDIEGPRYRVLAERIEQSINNGELRAHGRLPAERELAKALQVSRTTVVNAYDVLRQRGQLTSRAGSGTFVVPNAPTRHDTQLGDLISGVVGADTPGVDMQSMVNLSISHPEPVVRDMVEALVQTSDTIGSLMSKSQYAPQGLPALRSIIADLFTLRGLPTNARQILITNGAQQAISLLCQLYVRAGKTAVLESPTYPGAIDALKARDAHIVGLPGTTAELDPAEIEKHIRRVRPDLMFLMPACHAVTGQVTPELTQRRLAELSKEFQLPIISDEIFAELTVPDHQIPPLASYAEGAPIFSIGSTSKLIWNGLRVGWIRAPEAVVLRLTRMKEAIDLGTSLALQELTTHLLVNAESIADRRRKEIRRRLDTVTGLLAAALPEWVWTPPQGGRSLWIDLGGVSATWFAEAALRQGVLVAPGPSLAPGKDHESRLRLIFVQPPDVLAEGIDRLATAWGDRATAGRARRE